MSKKKEQTAQELPKLLKVSPLVVREVWWRTTHLRALKPNLIVLVHKNQAQVGTAHIRIRFGEGKRNIVVLPLQFLKTLKGKEFTK